MKIKSLLINKNDAQIRNKYEEIFNNASVWLYKKFDSVHSIMHLQIKKYLINANVLDIGCGAGRLALMSATKAKRVDAFDFSERAIVIAKEIARMTGTQNANFIVSNLDDLICENKKYDTITMSEVIEHVHDPIVSLKKINKLLNRNGILALSCPNFNNFRGHVYMTLLKLFDLPMSLADLRQISHSDIIQWCEKSGFKVLKTIGALYNFGWTQKGVGDMVQRIPLAIRDKKIKAKIEYGKLNKHMSMSTVENKLFLEYLIKNKILSKIDRQVKLTIKNKSKTLEADFIGKIQQYINEDLSSDPFYCEIAPFNYQGADSIYILKKVR